MASLPPRDDPAMKSIPRMYNRFAKRDPQLYPLAAIMITTLGIAGYFLTVRKPQQVPEPGKNFSSTSQATFPPNVGSNVSRWKEQHKRAPGDESFRDKMRRSEVDMPEGGKGTISTR